ncbi:glycosyltransferase [Desulfovibrio sp. OttesenSCG-928-G15]|nr:glycosyltransferase [Desulfovibrio sp. OttesenSCG-928-G15]
MRKLLWIGEPYFHDVLSRCGWQITWRHPKPGEVFTWQDCLDMVDGEPDLVAVTDNSRRPFVLGIEELPCPTVYYAVDTHIHSWLPLYAQAFDACLVSLKDHIPLFHMRLPKNRVLWSPPYAASRVTTVAKAERDLDVVFIGSFSAENTPIRVSFFQELREFFPSLIAKFGDYYDFFPRAKVVVNICECGDLNFRVFETLGLGAALVTPEIANGQSDLFTDGLHLRTYPLEFSGTPEEIAHRAVPGAVECIRQLLDDVQNRQAIAEAGQGEVFGRHLDIRRAEAFTALAGAIGPAEVAARRNTAENIRNRYLKLVYLHWAEHIEDARERTQYIQAAKGWGVQKKHTGVGSNA